MDIVSGFNAWGSAWSVNFGAGGTPYFIISDTGQSSQTFLINAPDELTSLASLAVCTTVAETIPPGVNPLGDSLLVPFTLDGTPAILDVRQQIIRFDGTPRSPLGKATVRGKAPTPIPLSTAPKRTLYPAMCALLALTNAATAPVVTGPAIIAGSAVHGNPLSVTVQPTFSGTPAPAFTYQWKQDGVAIPGATGQTYLTVAGDVGHNIRCDVSGTNYVGSATAASNQIGPIT